MANDISDAFVKQYAYDVKLAFQRTGSLLLNTVRRKTGIVGSTQEFFAMGTGTATTKSRNGLVIPMNPTHTPVTATLADRYAPEYVDKLDEQKMTYDEKAALVSTGAWALGRAADQDIIDVLDAATTYDVAVGITNLNLDKIMEALYDNLFSRYIPDDGQTTFVIGPIQWSALMQIANFASADYVGPGNLPMNGPNQGGSKRWLNCNWVMHSGLTKVGNVRTCFAYHKNAVGHASGQDITTEINYVPERVAHLVTSMMSMGAVVIEAAGIVHIHCDETA
jgi:hypothetical protein